MPPKQTFWSRIFAFLGVLRFVSGMIVGILGAVIGGHLLGLGVKGYAMGFLIGFAVGVGICSIEI